MLSVAVCDDEIIECCKLSKRIKEILEAMKVPCMVHQFGSGKELLQASEGFDIIFLDIMMWGMDGMETARSFRERSYEKILVFVSSSREYVLEAYDVEAFHYLLKPVEDKKLKAVLQRAVQKTQRSPREFIIASKERQRRKLFLDDIYYFEIKGRVIDVHGVEGIFAYYGQIGVLERELFGKNFFRCHKSYLLHFKFVEGYNRREAILENGERIVIAKRRYEDFCQEMLKYMRKSGGIL